MDQVFNDNPIPKSCDHSIWQFQRGFAVKSDVDALERRDGNTKWKLIIGFGACVFCLFLLFSKDLMLSVVIGGAIVVPMILFSPFIRLTARADPSAIFTCQKCSSELEINTGLVEYLFEKIQDGNQLYEMKARHLDLDRGALKYMCDATSIGGHPEVPKNTRVVIGLDDFGINIYDGISDIMYTRINLSDVVRIEHLNVPKGERIDRGFAAVAIQTLKGGAMAETAMAASTLKEIFSRDRELIKIGVMTKGGYEGEFVLESEHGGDCAMILKEEKMRLELNRQQSSPGEEQVQTGSPIQLLNEIKTLCETGVITEAQYNAKRVEILSRI